MKKSLVFLLTIFTLFAFISCGSTPEPTPTEEPKAPVEEVIEEVLSPEEEAALLAKVNDARERAISVGAQEKLPAKLQDLDIQFEAAKKDKAKLKAEAETIADGYNKLADEVSALLDSEKEDALKAEEALKAQQQLLEDIKAKASEAKELLSIIEENGLNVYAPENYTRGKDKLSLVEKAFAEKTTFDASDLQNAEDALKELNKVKTAALKSKAKEERSNAYAAKKDADSVNAGVSQKERYQQAAENFKKGDALYAMQSPEKAIDYYISAKDEYNDLYNEIYEKRAAAMKAIEDAKKVVEESANYAAEADVSSPITGENIAGIEDEDAVLLEADNYENPEDAEIEIAETFEKEVINTATDVVNTASDIINNNPEDLPEAAANATSNLIQGAVDLQKESSQTVEVGEK